VSRTDIDGAQPNLVFCLEVEACGDHHWQPVFEDTDIYDDFEASATANGMKRNPSFVDRVFPDDVKLLQRENFVLDTDARCAGCSKIRPVRVEICWNALEELTEWMDPLLGDSITPKIIHTFVGKVNFTYILLLWSHESPFALIISAPHPL